MSHDHTLARDTGDVEKVRALILALSDKLVNRLRLRNSLARTVTLRLRYADFTTITRDRTLGLPTDNLDLICRTARSLMPVERLQRKMVRLVGVKVSKLIIRRASRQVDLFAERSKGDVLADVVGKLRDRYGYDVIFRGGAQRDR
jgi:DNA polymerase-4